MMNKRPDVRAESAHGEALDYLRATGAEGSHVRIEGISHIILDENVATRRTIFHEWLHRNPSIRNGDYVPGEDRFIEDLLSRFTRTLGLE